MGKYANFIKYNFWFSIKMKIIQAPMHIHTHTHSCTCTHSYSFTKFTKVIPWNRTMCRHSCHHNPYPFVPPRPVRSCPDCLFRSTCFALCVTLSIFILRFLLYFLCNFFLYTPIARMHLTLTTKTKTHAKIVISFVFCQRCCARKLGACREWHHNIWQLQKEKGKENTWVLVFIALG